MSIRKVLAVDDDEWILAGYRSGFSRPRYEVFTARCADSAIAVARVEQPDLAIVDLRLEKTWGIVLIRRLRILVPAARIVLVSGFVSVPTAIAAVRAGADHVLPKPVTPSIILRELSGSPVGEEPDDHLASLEAVERQHVLRALTECEGNVSAAARRLRIRRTSLQRLLKRASPP